MLKQAIKVGNSAGVLLPRSYLGSLVEIKIKTLNKEEIKKQILGAIYQHLNHVIGIYIVGSYARNEEGIDSDVDIIILTNKDIELKLGNYHIICLNYDALVKELEENIVEYYPMLLEAETILNEIALQNLLRIKITRKNLQWHLKSSKSALNVIETALKTNDEELIVNEAIVYSLILRLRSIYLVDCILDRKKGTIKGLFKYSAELKSIKRMYEIYRLLKNSDDVKVNLDIDEIEICYNFVKDKLKRQELRINGLKEKEKTVRKEN